MKISVKKNWNCLVRRKAKLVHLHYRKIPSFESYKESELKSFPDLFKNYTDYDLKINYNEYVDYLNHFNGCCRTNETVDIISTDRPDVVIFSSNWKGKVALGSDMELWLWKDYDLSLMRSGFKCQMYKFERIQLTEQDPELIFGGRRQWIQSNSIGIYDVIFDNYKKPRTIAFVNTSGWGGSKGANFEII